MALSREEKIRLLSGDSSPEEPATTPLSREQKISLLSGGSENSALTPDTPKEISGYQGILPRTYKADVVDNSGLGRKILAAGEDVLSLPGRALGSISKAPSAYPNMTHFGTEEKRQNQDFMKSMSDTEGSGFVQKLIRDPALLPGLATGGALVKGATELGLTGLKALSSAGAAAGAQSAVVHQADNVSQGKEINPLSAAMEVGTGAVIPYAAKGAAMAAHGGNKLLGKLAQEFSGVSEEALRTHGTGFGQGAKDLANAAGKQHEIGQKLVNVLDNIDDYLPEKNIVDQALHQMPAINISNTVSTLEKAKTGGALSSSRAVNEKIDGLISDLQGAADETGHIPAPAFRQIRKEIDGLVGDSFGKEAGNYVNALKTARYQMADDLTKSAEASGVPEYADAMKSMSQKLQAADKLKSFLGKSAQTRDSRAESFVSTLFGKNKQDRQAAVTEIEKLFGGDFTKEAKLANLAAELGQNGEAGFLPRQFTGRSALGPTVAALGGHFIAPASGVPALALSSPRIASGILAGSGAIDQLANRGVSAMERVGSGQAGKAIENGFGWDESDLPGQPTGIPRTSMIGAPEAMSLPPRRPIGGDVESNWPPRYVEDPKIQAVLDGIQGRRMLAPTPEPTPPGLPPRRPIGPIVEGNLDHIYPENPKIRAVLDNTGPLDKTGRRELPPQALRRIEEALKTAKGAERAKLLAERAAVNGNNS